MKRIVGLAALTTGLLSLCAPPVAAQLSAFEFDAARVPVGKVFHVVKSNLDGSHEARVSYFVAAPDRVEALKWDEGGEQATLVIARLDWARFSVRAFRVSHLVRGSQPEARATMDVNEAGQLTTSVMSEPVQLTHFPWHSFDFDFTGLTLAMPHLRYPQADFSFWRTDFVYGNPPAMAELGEVTMKFIGNEKHNGRRARRYTIGGPGLQGRSGTWWADAKTGLLVEFEIPLGDEPGYDSVRIRLDRVAKMNDARWEEFKRHSIGER